MPNGNARPCGRCSLSITIQRKAINNTAALIPPCPWVNFTSATDGNGSCCHGAPTQLALWHEDLLHGYHSRVNMWAAKCYPLSASDLGRSLRAPGDSRRLPGVIRRVASGHNITIVVIGGSVAMGAGARGGMGHQLGTPSSQLFANWLQRRYPLISVRFHSLALPGTTTQSRVSGLGVSDVEALRPDLVIWDYTSNDYGAYAADPMGYRAALERLVRSVLTLPTRPALILLGLLSTGYSDDLRTWRLQDEALRPVTDQYRVPLVSYRDVVYPEFGSIRPELKNAVNGEGWRAFGVYATNDDNRVHLKQSTHVLIADTLAYAWVATEAAHVHRSVPATAQQGGAASGNADAADDEDSLPSALKFQLPDALASASADAATACQGGWKSSLTNAELHRMGTHVGAPMATKRVELLGAQAPPIEAPGSASLADHEAWIFNTSHPQKQGWQFSMARSRLYLARAADRATRDAVPEPAIPRISTQTAAQAWASWAAQYARRVDTLEPIAFRVRLGAHPRVAISYLRSYATFGRALWWIDGEAGRERALQVYRRHLTMEIVCARATAKCASESTWATKMYCINSLPDAMAQCRSQALGLAQPPEPPHILEGRWDDRSSQAFTAGLLEWQAARGAGGATSTRALAAEFVVNSSLPLAMGDGASHTVSVAMLWPDYSSAAFRLAHDGGASAADAGPPPPWRKGHATTSSACAPTGGQCRDEAQFKVLAVFSC